MQKGIAILVVIVALAILISTGVSGYVIAKNLSESERPRGFVYLKRIKSTISDKTNSLVSPSPAPNTSQTVDNLDKNQPSPLPSSSVTIYKQPQGKYTIELPYGWIVNTTTATSTYSTTKFTGSDGNVSITFGSGKDPIGGCSETTSITLADRTISGCFLLQKDGSRILTRAYTKDKAGFNFTIEAYINPPLSTNSIIILNVLKTVDIE